MCKATWRRVFLYAISPPENIHCSKLRACNVDYCGENGFPSAIPSVADILYDMCTFPVQFQNNSCQCDCSYVCVLKN